MQRQRGELVPIGEAVAAFTGSALALGPPQRGFTVADQVHQLVGASEADPDRGFMARTMALCSLPRSNPANRLQYKRVNGPYTLYMTVTGSNKLPYGTLPRLILAWVSTEAVRTQSPVLSLGKSLSEFMRALGVYDTGGRTQRRLQNQMKWNPRRPDQPSLWESKIELSEPFFQEIIRHPVPLDLNTLTALKRSSLGLDLYLWLVYRTFPLRASQRLTWKQLYRQFGLHPAKASDKVTVQNFRRKVIRELKKIKIAWPELNYSLGKGVLILHPSTPTIAPVAASPRLAQ